MAHAESTTLRLGTTAPEFAPPDVIRGNVVRRHDFRGRKGMLAMLICTHCAYIKHIESELARFGADCAESTTSVVAIGNNDAATLLPMDRTGETTGG